MVPQPNSDSNGNSSTPYERVTELLEEGRDKFICPAHDDRKESLSITEAEDGTVLVYCHAGCETKDVLAAIGLTMADLYPSNNGHGIVWEWHDENGNVIGKHAHKGPWIPKRPESADLYNKPELLEGIRVGDTALFVEGEQDSETGRDLGFPTTTTGSATSFTKERAAQCVRYFRGADVVIIPDNDAPGEAYARAV